MQSTIPSGTYCGNLSKAVCLSPLKDHIDFFWRITYTKSRTRNRNKISKKDMKKEVKMSCGHIQVVDLPIEYAQAEKRMRYFQTEGMCKDCYAAYKRKLAENTPLSVVIQMQPSNQYKIIRVRFVGNAKPHKQSLKDLGYQWGNLDKEIGVFCVTHKNRVELGGRVWIRKRKKQEHLQQNRC